MAVAWIFDAAVEDKFAVSISSLAANAPDVWRQWAKIIVDVGVSPKMREWLESLRSEHVYILSVDLPPPSELVGGKPHRAAQVMLRRLRLPALIADSAAEGRIPATDRFLHVDADTVFFRSPKHLAGSAAARADITAARETDWVGNPSDGIVKELRMTRPHCYLSARRDRDRVLARGLGLSVRELLSIPSYNSGVWVASPTATLTEAWETAYAELRSVDRQYGGSLLDPHSAEENALSLAVYRGWIRAGRLPSRYNQLPPREPHNWPSQTVIGHFVTFERNRHWPAYRRWFAQRASLAEQNRYWPPFMR